MPAFDRSIDIKVADFVGPLHAGVWAPLTLTLTRPADAPTGVRLRHFACQDKDVQLDLDLLPHDVEIRPGESFCLTVPFRVGRPRTLGLEKFNVQIDDDLVDLPARPLVIGPAIGREIAVRVEPICPYEEGSKVQMVLAHQGATTFRDVTVTLGPEAAIRAGKRVIRRATFGPGDTEQVDVVVAAAALEVHLQSGGNGEAAEARVTRPVERIPTREERTFRFLEPRRLSVDQKAVFEVDRDTLRPVEPVRAAYPLYGGGQYLIEVRPQVSRVTQITLRDIPGQVHVRHREHDAPRNAWKFWIDVTHNEVLSKPERLFYDVEAGADRLTGEVHLVLRPPRRKHFLFATALGVALTVQGLHALGKALLSDDFSLGEALSGFHLSHDYPLLFLFCIPLFWLGLALGDRLQYRLRT